MSKETLISEVSKYKGRIKGWPKIAQRHGYSSGEAARMAWFKHRSAEALSILANQDEYETQLMISTTNKVAEANQHVDLKNNTLTSDIELDFKPKTVEELAELHQIDTTKYRISSYWSKLKSNGKFTSSVFATGIKIEQDLAEQKRLLSEELKKESPVRKLIQKSTGKFAYEINIPDVHFGKLAWAAESGEDYDINIAEKRYREAIETLLTRVNLRDIERIIFPIGNDMINIDSRRNDTFAGTRQDSDSRFFKIVRTVKTILIDIVRSLTLIAPVDIIVISGNHDSESMFMIGEMLDCYFHNDENVSVDNSPAPRKYYKYGRVGLQYSHGNEENHKDLGNVFSTESTDIWASTDIRICKLGHLHKNKTLSYVSVDEFQGFKVQILPSLSGSDAWHKTKGYMSLKQAKAFSYHKEEGEIGEFTYTVKYDK